MACEFIRRFYRERQTTPAEYVGVGFSTVVLALLTATGLAGVRYGAPPPDVALPIAAGPRVAIEKGKPAVIHFWATWCHVCLDELPRFVTLKKHYGPSIDVISVSNEPADVAASYLRLWNMTDLPLVADTTGSVFKAYGVGPLPVTVVLDGSGNVAFSQIGELTAAGLDRAVAASLTPVP